MGRGGISVNYQQCIFYIYYNEDAWLIDLDRWFSKIVEKIDLRRRKKLGELVWWWRAQHLVWEHGEKGVPEEYVCKEEGFYKWKKDATIQEERMGDKSFRIN